MVARLSKGSVILNAPPKQQQSATASIAAAPVACDASVRDLLLLSKCARDHTEPIHLLPSRYLPNPQALPRQRNGMLQKVLGCVLGLKHVLSALKSHSLVED